MSELSGARCAECGRMWTGGSTVFCEHCGASLLATGPDEPGEPGETATASRGPRWWWFALAGLAVVAIVGTAVLLEPGDTAEDPPAAGVEDPEAPAPESPEPFDVFAEVSEAGETVCEPEDCELWRFTLPGDGVTSFGDGFLVHMTLSSSQRPPEDADDGQAAPEQLTERVSVVDLEDGEPRWHEELVVQGGAEGGSGVVEPFGDLVLVPGEDGLEAYDVEDGVRRWETGFGRGTMITHEHDGDLLVLMERDPEGSSGSEPPADEQEPEDTEEPEAGAAEDPGAEDPDGETGAPPTVLARLDPETGEVRWRVDDVSLPAFGDAFVVVQDRESERLLALDLADGTPRWERGTQVDPADRQIVATAGRVAISTPDGIEVMEFETGQTVLELDETPAGEERVSTRLIGSLLILEPFPATREVTPRWMEIHDLDDPAGSVLRLDGVVGSLVLHDPVGEEAQPGDEPSGASGLAILQLVDETYHLRVLDLDGFTRWETEREAPDQRCCWALVPGGDEHTLVLAPADLEQEPVRVLATADGGLEAEFELPADTSRADHVTWHGPLVMMQRTTGTDRLAVLGPEGWFAAGIEHDGARTQTLAPVPIVQVGYELVALDRELLGANG